MKELSIEEKAQRYDEAIERARAINNGEDVDVEAGITTCEYIFPELKESEDEEIKKKLISYFSAVKGFSTLEYNYGITNEDAIAWLEKQGNLMKALQISNARIGELIEKNYYLKEQLEKQGEQKTDDRVEQKFKVGDWINGYYTNYKVLSVNNEGYEVEDTDGNKINILFENEKFHHLWTIQDAKDGDVLTCYSDIKGQPIEQTGIIKQYVGRHGGCYNSFKAYFGVDWDNNVVIEGYMGSSNIYPATKEQRDLLFQKMKEAGYDWDVEKKKLKEIEEEVNGEDYGIDSLYHAQRILEKTLGKVDGYQSDDGILEHKCAISTVKKLYEQKPEWSEEDETMLEYALDMIEWYGGKNADKSRLVSDWLKSLKDRVQPQPKQEWSEKDKCMLNNVIDTLKPLSQTTHSGYAINSMIDWLLSLKERYTWKPSDEQMKAFDSVLVYNPPCSNECRNHLITLYNDLEKLRKE